ncbi:MAG: hypothetical protein H7338_23820, partial [Candidatus Sericytochromatia bacterium]|nr:hypothetical protein [Candidatus Sericytochromatia bacterium]
MLICRFLWWLALPFAGGGTLAAYHAATTLSGHVIIHETLGRAEIATVPGMVLDQHFDSRIGSKGRSLTEYYVRYGFRPMTPGAPSAPGAPAADRIISERLVDQATYRRNRPSTPITVRYVAGRP